MDDGAQGWMVKQARRALRELRPQWELADLVQEGHFLFQRLEMRYPGRAAPLMMALFKIAYGNLLTDIRRHHRHTLSISLACDLDVSLDRLAGGAGDAAQAWCELPKELQEIVALNKTISARAMRKWQRAVSA